MKNSSVVAGPLGGRKKRLEKNYPGRELMRAEALGAAGGPDCQPLAGMGAADRPGSPAFQALGQQACGGRGAAKSSVWSRAGPRCGYVNACAHACVCASLPCPGYTLHPASALPARGHSCLWLNTRFCTGSVLMAFIFI